MTVGIKVTIILAIKNVLKFSLLSYISKLFTIPKAVIYEFTLKIGVTFYDNIKHNIQTKKTNILTYIEPICLEEEKIRNKLAIFFIFETDKMKENMTDTDEY